MLIVCHGCQSKIRVPDRAAGKKGKCPKCGTILTIPAAAPPPDAAAPPPLPPELPEIPEVDVHEEPPAAPLPTAYAADIPPPLPPEPPPVPKVSRRADRDDEDDAPRRRRYHDEDEDDDLNIRRPRRKQETGMALTAMILGISGLVVTLGSITVGIGFTFGTGGCCCFIFGGYAGLAVGGILAIVSGVFAFIGLNHGGRGFAWAGMITSIVNLVLIVLYVILSLVLGAAFFAFFAALVGQQQQNVRQPGPFGPPGQVRPR
jgi:hypothetical protein